MAVNERVYGGFRRTRGDATFPEGVLTILVPITIRALHYASAADETGSAWRTIVSSAMLTRGTSAITGSPNSAWTASLELRRVSSRSFGRSRCRW